MRIPTQVILDIADAIRTAQFKGASFISFRGNILEVKRVILPRENKKMSELAIEYGYTQFVDSLDFIDGPND